MLTDADILDRIHEVDKRVVRLEEASTVSEDISDDSTVNLQVKIALIGLTASLILTVIYVLLILKVV